MSDKLIALFPTTLLVTKYEDDFKKEFKYIRELEYADQQITGVFRSKDSYLMKHPELSKLKEFFLEGLDKYASSILGTDKKLSITQAWVQRNVYQSFTHDHSHANSIVSGVFYFRNEKHAGISFNKSTIDRIVLPKVKNHRLNSEAWHFEPLSGELILFPSQTRHSVTPNVKKESRYSLSFNSFCFDELGVQSMSTHLKIKGNDGPRL